MPLEDKIFHYGERGSLTKTKSGRPQVYEKILRKCQQENKLFEDPEFPCNDSSINIPQWSGHIVWKRPTQIMKRPRFFVGGATRDDVRQVYLGNCWFLAALAGLTQHEELFDRVVPKEQSFKQGLYAGVFHFVFWNANRWVDVVVDDRLPMLQDGSLVGLKSGDANEFWSSLLEKAYAKFYGSYGALHDGGSSTEAMSDLTGGIPEKINPLPKDTWDMFKNAIDRKSMISVYFVDPNHSSNSAQHDGLAPNHAYSVTGVAQLDVAGKMVKLVRIRNPWGHTEYNGPWSDTSSEWQQVPRSKRQEVGVVVRDDGEFWMDVEYLTSRFESAGMCHLKPDNVTKSDALCWKTAAFEGSWVAGVSSGGPDRSREEYGTNPQYLVTLPEPENKSTSSRHVVLLSLRQKGKRVGISAAQFGSEFKQWNDVGICVYKVENPESCPKPIPTALLRSYGQGWRVDGIGTRDVTWRLYLLPGTYCVVPHAEHVNKEGQFLLRIFTEQKSECCECDRDVDVPKKVTAEDIEDKPEHEEVKDIDTPTIDKGPTEKGTMSPEELRHYLNENFQIDGEKVDFPLDVCHTMRAYVDKDLSGEVDDAELSMLYAFLRDCQDAFQAHDKDRTGSISTSQLIDALDHAGCYVNQRILKSLVKRYSRENKIDFVNFVACAVKVALMEDIHKQYAEEDGSAALSLDEWMEIMTQV